MRVKAIECKPSSSPHVNFNAESYKNLNIFWHKNILLILKNKKKQAVEDKIPLVLVSDAVGVRCVSCDVIVWMGPGWLIQ